MAKRHKPIVFVKERAKAARIECNTESASRGELPQNELSGTEAKNFYEHVISTPEESATGRFTTRKKRKRTKAKKVSRTLQTDHPSVAHTSVDQVFRYVQEGDLDRVRRSVSGGVCDIDTTDHFNWTLLMSAAHAGHVHVVEYLLRMGAKWREYVDRSGCNAVDLAKRAGHLSLACFIEAYNVGVEDREGVSETVSKDDDCRTRIELPTPKATTTYYCDVCKQTVTEHPTKKHTTSTVHQFSCHHQPSVPGYVIPRGNRGYQMMLRGGWDPEKGLGSEQEGRKFPIKTILKQDRLGLGQGMEESSHRKARVTHFAAFDERAVKRRSERFEKTASAPRKKDILAAKHKDKQWEARMRRYMNSDDYNDQYT